MGQTLCKWLPSTRTVCVETQEAAVLREPGESQVSLPLGRGVLGVCLRRRGRQGHAGTPQAPWAGPLCSLARGPRLGYGCLLAPLGLHCPFPSTASGPAPQLARQAQSSPWGTWPGKVRSLLLLSPLQHVCSVTKWRRT